MNKKLSIFMLVALSLGLLAFYAGSRFSAAPEQTAFAAEPSKDLSARVGKLEAQVAALQAQIRDLSLKSSSQFLALPRTQARPGDKMPPGATEHEFSGMKYWVVPLKDGK
jgi:hypothetical protein